MTHQNISTTNLLERGVVEEEEEERRKGETGSGGEETIGRERGQQQAAKEDLNNGPVRTSAIHIPVNSRTDNYAEPREIKILGINHSSKSQLPDMYWSLGGLVQVHLISV